MPGECKAGHYPWFADGYQIHCRVEQTQAGPRMELVPMPNVKASLPNSATLAGDLPVPLRTLYLSFKAQPQCHMLCGVPSLLGTSPCIADTGVPPVHHMCQVYKSVHSKGSGNCPTMHLRVRGGGSTGHTTPFLTDGINDS